MIWFKSLIKVFECIWNIYMIKLYKSLYSCYKLIVIFDFSDIRYLLFLMENYGVLIVIEKNILLVEMFIIIFGSSFLSD